MNTATCVSCQRALAPDDTHGLCASCMADSLAGALGSPGAASAGAGLAGYELMEELSRGGMGIVYRARHRGLNRLVALKIVHATAGGAQDGIERLRQEAELAATLEHPNIIPVYDVGEVDGRPWFTMKLAEGGSLADRLAEFRLPSPATRADLKARLRRLAELFTGIARGVHHAHQHGILHRDLKPSNILLDRDGSPLVADFGIALRSDVDATLTLSGQALGTPAYLAPEVARDGARAAAVAADVYGLGAVLFHLLTGRAPYVGATAFEVLTQISTAEIPSPATLNPALPPDWTTLCLKCLERDPERRYASSLEVAEEFDRLLSGQPILARPVSGPERLWRWSRRRPLVALLVVLMLFTVGLGLSGVFWQWQAAEGARRLAEFRAGEAQAAEDKAKDTAYFATLAHALAMRQQGDFSHAQRLLESLDASRRGFEWRLLRWLCRGDETRRVIFESSEPRCVAWEPNRGRLAVLTADRVIRWVDPANGAQETGPTVPPVPPINDPEVLERGFHHLAFAPDGRHFLCADGDVLLVGETDSGTLRFFAGRRHVGAEWLDNQRVLFAGNSVWGGENGAAGGVYDLATGRATPLPREILAPVAVSADRTRLAWVRQLRRGDQVEIFPAAALGSASAPQWRPELELRQTNISPGLMAFSPDGKHLGVATARQTGVPRTVSVFDLADGRSVFHHEAAALVHDLEFSPKEPALAVATDDSPLQLFRFLQPTPDVQTYDDDTFGNEGQPVPDSGPRVPPANLLTRSALAGQVQFRLGHGERLRDLAYIPDSGLLASVSDDGTLRAWPARPAVTDHRVGGVWSWNHWEHPAMSADGRFALYRAPMNHTWLWDRLNRRTLPLAAMHQPLAILRDGSAVTRHFDTGEIIRWSPPGERGEAPQPHWRVNGIPSFPGFGFVVRGALSADEQTVVGLIPGKLLRVNLADQTTAGTEDQRMLYGASAVNCMDLSPDGRLVAVTGLIGRRVRLYPAGNLNGGFVSLGDAEDYDTAVAFHPDGRRLFVGNEDGHVRVFDVSTRRELPGESWRAQSGAVTALAVSAAGEVVASSGDRTITFWAANPRPGEVRRERLRVSVPAPRNWMRFTADDTGFMHIAPGHALEAWEAPK
jgi:WD40 repeat protein